MFYSARTQITPALIVDDLLVSHMRVANKLWGVVGNAATCTRILARIILEERSLYDTFYCKGMVCSVKITHSVM